MFGVDSFPTSYSNYNQNLGLNQNHIKNDHQQSEIGRQTQGSLMRYHSLPSEFYSNLLDERGCDGFLDLPLDTSSNHEFFSRLQLQHQQQQQQERQPMFQSDSCEFIRYESSSSRKQEAKESGIQKIDFTPMPRLRPSNTNDIYNNINMENSSRFRSMNSQSSNLIRQSSSPAGFLSSLNSESGFTCIKDVEKTISSRRLKNNITFSPGGSSSSMFLPQNPENRNQINDSSFKSLKRTRDGDSITFDIQDGSSTHYTPSLVHHLSLPKTSSEMTLAEKFLRFEDLIPSQSRAKRGFATHPRSIAERVRRTRISNRMKKLQELFPNMDKQTSIADMLDISIQYIKDLQKDLQTLKDARLRCACSSKQY